MEAVIGPKLRKESTLCENFRSRSRDEQFVRIERVDDFTGVERVELDAEIGVSKFGSLDDFLNALSKGRFRLRASRGPLWQAKDQ
jgi:uncharacterized protein YcgL (UPF0745 family)